MASTTVTTEATDLAGIHRTRLFVGVCLALIPTGASFALVSNILIPLKEEFILTNYQVGLIGGAALWGMAISLLVLGPMLEGYGLKNGTRLAFLGHVLGVTLMISAVALVGSPYAFWVLMLGAATLAMGNGMIEVAGNPLVAALYPDQKTVRLNWFHAFFPLGIIIGGLIGFAMVNWGGFLGYWPYQLAVIYLPIAVYGILVLPESFPRTENAEAGLPVGEMFRFTLTSPLFLLILAMMGVAISIELGTMRWVPAILEAVGMHGILVLVWISGWMVVLRLLASHFVERLSPPGMLAGASVLTAIGLFLMSYVDTLWTALAAATFFAWGIAFFFPTIVGIVSERLPKTGSLGIVLTAGVGLGAAGAIGVPAMGSIADRYLAEALDPPATIALLEQVEEQFPAHLQRAAEVGDPAALGYRERDVRDALGATEAALQEYRERGVIAGDATANALRAIMASGVPGEPAVQQAAAILQPAEAYGGQTSLRVIAPLALILTLVFGVMYLRDRRRGGYRAIRLEKLADQPGMVSEMPAVPEPRER
jgi:fucose permease